MSSVVELFWCQSRLPDEISSDEPPKIICTAAPAVMLNTALVVLLLLTIAEFSRIASKSRIIVPLEFSKPTPEIMISSPSGSSPESAEIVPVLTIPPETSSVPEINMPPAFSMSPERFISAKSLTVIVLLLMRVPPLLTAPNLVTVALALLLVPSLPIMP
jgi:hypothetical protein